jgi:hypothetical protein
MHSCFKKKSADFVLQSCCRPSATMGRALSRSHRPSNRTYHQPWQSQGLLIVTCLGMVLAATADDTSADTAPSRGSARDITTTLSNVLSQWESSWPEPISPIFLPGGELAGWNEDIFLISAGTCWLQLSGACVIVRGATGCRQ